MQAWADDTTPWTHHHFDQYGLHADLSVFLSRRVQGTSGEDLVEKQNAEQGLMPVISDEPAAYGYVAENRHMVRCFLDGHAKWVRADVLLSNRYDNFGHDKDNPGFKQRYGIP